MIYNLSISVFTLISSSFFFVRNFFYSTQLLLLFLLLFCFTFLTLSFTVLQLAALKIQPVLIILALSFSAPLLAFATRLELFIILHLLLVSESQNHA